MPHFTFPVLKQAIKIYSTGGDFMSYLRANTNQGSKAVKRDLDKLQPFLDTGTPAFSIWTQGNGKLPFLSFSAAPGEGVCPGAGDCLDFCYSFKSWRTFTPFARQLQNTILLDTQAGRDHITRQLDLQLSKRKYRGRTADIRLYVDGDFRSRDEIRFWFDAIENRPVKVYGYSKSLNLFRNLWVEGEHVPANYKLNLSSGGKYDHLHDFLLQTGAPWVRGRFVAVPIVQKGILDLTRADRRVMINWAKAEFGTASKNVVCPGRCGDCTKFGHICGLDKFDDYNVLISVH